MKRLYWQVYVTFVGILLLFGLLMALAFTLAPTNDRRGLDALARVAEELLPGPDSSNEAVQARLDRIYEELHVSATLWGSSGQPLASAGESLPSPQPSWRESRFLRARGAGLTVALAFSDGRWAVFRHHRQSNAPAGGFVAGVLLLGLAVAVGAYPLARWLTGRVERLGRRVDALAAGELGARVEVEGRDEVARLAESFNRAAERIERLVDAQRTLLAGVSHELRSPLTRIRMATELLGDDVRPELRERISEDIEELDALLSELLLASRLDALEAIDSATEVDLLALAVEEASRFDADVTGVPVVVEGDERLLRRLLRNLLSNAKRYAPASTLEVAVRALDGGQRVMLSVTDGGPGVPVEERERIFEPFFRGEGSRTLHEDGVGLGLSLVERIARLHGGEARYVAPAGGGSRFEIELSRGKT